MELSRKNILSIVLVLALALALVATVCLIMDAPMVAYAAESGEEVAQNNNVKDKAYASAIAIAVVAAAGAIGMSIAIAKAVEGIAKQPEAEGKIRTSLLLGLVFIETAIIYALIVAILIVFVL